MSTSKKINRGNKVKTNRRKHLKLIGGVSSPMPSNTRQYPTITTYTIITPSMATYTNPMVTNTVPSPTIATYTIRAAPMATNTSLGVGSYGMPL